VWQLTEISVGHLTDFFCKEVHWASSKASIRVRRLEATSFNSLTDIWYQQKIKVDRSVHDNIIALDIDSQFELVSDRTGH
jgi:hypothetical protein